SASMEIGYAAGAGVPIFASHAPSDLTLHEYVSVVRSLSDAISIVEAAQRERKPEGILIDPHASLQKAHATLEAVSKAIAHSNGQADVSRQVYRDLAEVRAGLLTPTLLQ